MKRPNTPIDKQIDYAIRETFRQIGPSHCPSCFVATVRTAVQAVGVEVTPQHIAARVPRALRLTRRAAATWLLLQVH